MKNTIFVEGKEDIPFVEMLIQNANIKEIFIDELKGAGQGNNSLITTRLKSFTNGFVKNPSEKLGIILDLDEYNEAERLSFLNQSINEVFGITLKEVGLFEKTEIEGIPLEIGCFFIKPNLDVLIREIASKNSEIADCLYSCLTNESIKPKERDKAWVYYYMLWDICDIKERENRSKHINISYTHSKQAWDLEHDVLNALKSFLENF